VGLKNSIQTIGRLAKEIDAEITVTESGDLNIFWKSLRFQPSIDEVPKIVEAIKVLTAVGFSNN
jgi:hypothetical protein